MFSQGRREGRQSSHISLRDGAPCVPQMQVRGRYRFARLVDKCGANVRMPNLLRQLPARCRQIDPRHPFGDRCGAYFADLNGPRSPPDLPTEGGRRMRVMPGDKEWVSGFGWRCFAPLARAALREASLAALFSGLSFAPAGCFAKYADCGVPVGSVDQRRERTAATARRLSACAKATVALLIQWRSPLACAAKNCSLAAIKSRSAFAHSNFISTERHLSNIS